MEVVQLVSRPINQQACLPNTTFSCYFVSVKELNSSAVSVGTTSEFPLLACPVVLYSPLLCWFSVVDWWLQVTLSLLYILLQSDLCNCSVFWLRYFLQDITLRHYFQSSRFIWNSRMFLFIYTHFLLSTTTRTTITASVTITNRTPNIRGNGAEAESMNKQIGVI